ncbi:MAG: LysE family transporter [Comamonadaceae bacterium]|nr:LysE family transporter [Comamonadaceae bacterium]
MFLDALWVGVAIAAPVGPIGLLVIQRTLRHGRMLGLATGLGAALAGGAFLLWLAWRTWRGAQPGQAAQVAERPGLAGAFVGTLLLTLSNPATIFAFAAVFGALGARADAAAPGSAWTMIAGVAAGSALWWLVLASAVDALRRHFDLRALRLVNRVSALALAAFALWQWLGLVRA